MGDCRTAVVIDMLRKLKSQRGETMIEALASVVIVAFATLLFTSMITVSANINLTQKESDAAFHEAQAKVEALDGTIDDGSASPISVEIKENGTIPLDTIDCQVTVADGLRAYNQ